MIRVKRGFIAKKRRKKISKKNYNFQISGLFRVINQKSIKAVATSYSGRKKRKRLFRNLWISRINAATRIYGLSFNQFIYQCKRANIKLNRKILSQLLIYEPDFLLNELNFYIN